MRFIIGFVFFALLFYAIWVYFPEAFNTLLTWDASVFNYLKDGINSILHPGAAPAPPPATPAKALLLISTLYKF